MHMLRYIWYVLSDCFCVTKCPGPYMLLMYQLRSSSAEIGVCPQASWIRVDVIVWAIVSECLVDGKEFLFEGVWFPVYDFVSEEDLVEKFSFILGYGVAVKEVVCYGNILSVVLLSEFKDVPDF